MKKKKYDAFETASIIANAVSLKLGTDTGEFNTRAAAFIVGMQLADLAKLMDAIYGENRFAISKDMKQWAEAFKRGDCDGPVAAGDRVGLLNVNAGIAISALVSIFLQGVDANAILHIAHGHVMSKIDPATGKFLPGQDDPSKWLPIDLSAMINQNK